MTAEEKSVLSLFMIGVLIVVGKVLAGGEPITPRLFIGRMLLGGFVSMVAGVVLVQFPDLSLPAVCGIGSMLGIAGYQVIEIAIQRRFKGRGNGFNVVKPRILHAFTPGPDVFTGHRTGMTADTFIEVKHHADLRTYFHFFASCT